MSGDWARSSLLRLNFACTGVSAVSVALIGPALPSIFKLPPPGSRAEATTGNALVNEKSRIVMLTLSYMTGLRFPEIDPREMVPSVRSSLATFTLDGAFDVFSAALAGCAD